MNAKKEIRNKCQAEIGSGEYSKKAVKLAKVFLLGAGIIGETDDIYSPDNQGEKTFQEFVNWFQESFPNVNDDEASEKEQDEQRGILFQKVVLHDDDHGTQVEFPVLFLVKVLTELGFTVDYEGDEEEEDEFSSKEKGPQNIIYINGSNPFITGQILVSVDPEDAAYELKRIGYDIKSPE
jgi:hypothetical protein